ncbi:MAG: hypothetical protein A4E65_01058 [Syntrophorhabdus sp. PtaU1.Bin153]|nr:MAG: hypothetical protein A4E65_01058 [Syntrophorhabdus sp. PtaU1.Bin153]
MKRKGLVLFIVSSLLAMTLPAGPGFTQCQTTTPTASAGMEKKTIKGTIEFDERLGGYFIRGVEPGGELFIIVNQNETTLKKFKESGKTVTIEGSTTERAAEHFFIDKIDGKEYSAGKAGEPAPKKAAPR